MSDLTIVVPLDGSSPAEGALRFIEALTPLKSLRVRLLSVIESDEADAERTVAGYMDAVRERLRREFGFPVECVRRTGQPFTEILEEALDQDVSLVLMTTHGRTSGTDDRLGSVADKVIRGAACPTLLVGPRAAVPSRIERITVALDGSDLAAEALPVARWLAEQLHARLRLVRAVEYPLAVESDSTGSLMADVVDSLEQTASGYLATAQRELGTAVTVETATLQGHPVEALLRDVEENRPDLLIMTSHGQTGFIKWALGSVTDRLIRGPVPVLVLRPRREAGGRLKHLI